MACSVYTGIGLHRFAETKMAPAFIICMWCIFFLRVTKGGHNEKFLLYLLSNGLMCPKQRV